jgi:excisionase family DNA binding protein
MSHQLYSVDQVADRLGLHVRTIRNYVRDGRLKAVRIGKQYRIAREDLEAFAGGPVEAPARETARRHRHVEVSSIVQIDAISADAAGSLTSTLMAAAAGRSDTGEPLRIETAYDEVRARMKIVVLGDLDASAGLFTLIGALIEPRP